MRLLSPKEVYVSSNLTGRSERSLTIEYRPVAQLVERSPDKAEDDGSSPSGPTEVPPDVVTGTASKAVGVTALGVRLSPLPPRSGILIGKKRRWKVGRVVYDAGLLNRCGVTAARGSNPLLSAT